MEESGVGVCSRDERRWDVGGGGGVDVRYAYTAEGFANPEFASGSNSLVMRPIVAGSLVGWLVC
jgi:hypothetical protein